MQGKSLFKKNNDLMNNGSSYLPFQKLNMYILLVKSLQKIIFCIVKNLFKTNSTWVLEYVRIIGGVLLTNKKIDKNMSGEAG